LFGLLIVTFLLLPGEIGKTKAKAKFSQVFSKTAAINWLSAARFFLFGARDVWFVVGLPVFLGAQLGWSHTEVGAFLALWVIGYGFVQASAPRLLRTQSRGHAPDGASARFWVFSLALLPAGIALALDQGFAPALVLIFGLAVFGFIFALNSALHSYLILSYSDHDKVSMNVGFYYMANAGGRLLGTVLSGATYQFWGLTGCLWFSCAMLLIAGLLSLPLPVAGSRAAVNQT
jgi:hypothetical protein